MTAAAGALAFDRRTIYKKAVTRRGKHARRSKEEENVSAPLRWLRLGWADMARAPRERDGDNGAWLATVRRRAEIAAESTFNGQRHTLAAPTPQGLYCFGDQADVETIATATRYVDDQNFEQWAIAQSAEGILGVATAHHPLSAGVRAVSRLEGRDDSQVVNAMLDFYLSRETMAAHRAHALHLMGIAAHVHADTFAHYGFSGIPSDHNLIMDDWQSMRGLVKDIIEREGKGDERAGYWMDAMANNYLPDAEPPRVYDDETWSSELDEFKNRGSPEQFIASDPYQFFCAADYHRGYVLKRLLPGFGLMVA